MPTSRGHGLLLGCLFFLLAGTLVVLAFSVLSGGPGPGSGFGLWSQEKVGLVLVEGPIVDSQPAVDELEANRRDRSVKAVVIRLDSPGGEVAPSQEIHEAVRRLADTKPVVASFGSVAASGAYYIAVAADTIVSTGGCLTGSIGVIFAYPTLRELMEKAGIEMEVFKSGELKDMGTFAREATEDEEAVFDGMVADVFDQFVTAVADGRDLERTRVLEIADGRVFTGRQAVELGLVDRIGDLHAAVELAATMGGLPPDPPVARKARPPLPFLDVIDRFLRDQARAAWGPRLEYRLR